LCRTSRGARARRSSGSSGPNHLRWNNHDVGDTVTENAGADEQIHPFFAAEDVAFVPILHGMPLNHVFSAAGARE
jgi:hypothetical protein